jgi:elongation factor P
MFEMDGQLLEIVTVEHIKLARAGAVIKAKLRNVKSGSIFEQSFRSGDKYRSVRIDKGEASFLYGDGDFYHFLDSDTYEEVVLGRDLVADLLPLMKEGATVSLLRYQDTLIAIELPITVELAVADTDPGLRGDTVSGATKPARLETGATVQVPLFVGVGDVIRVDTRTGNYMERV